ncbi:MAG: polysaccharide deacetylase family protein [Acidobacteriia bacterium]|nr:polysaccharide deacetylase family protein [Terriglobia bacterium]
MTNRAVTLLFHDVVPDGRWDSSGFQGADADVYKLDCADFRRHLAAIGESLRLAPTTGPALLARPSSEHPVLITFDDGGVSAALYIADMLEERAWKGHFFVTGCRIGTSGFLDRTQIRELHRRGHIIGSHSYSHPLRMAHCSMEQLDDEWHRSALMLAEILGEPIRVASVPGGDYSRQVAVAASRAGIKLLFNSEPVTGSHMVDGCLVMGRITVKRGHPPQRSAAIVAGDRQPWIQEYLFWNAKKVAKALLGGAWLRARVMLLERRTKRDAGPDSRIT